VVELNLNGQPLAMDQLVRVALNNYRATGKFPTAPKLYQSTVEVRELITNWIVARGTISPSDVFVQNFAVAAGNMAESQRMSPAQTMRICSGRPSTERDDAWNPGIRESRAT
jgi:hypothetical protein